MIFLDTNVVSETIRAKPDKAVVNWLKANQGTTHISTIVLAEIAAGIERLRPDARAKRLLGFLEETTHHFRERTHDFDVMSALQYGTIMGKAHREGFNPKTQDGMMAAIALRHGASLATRNVKDFKGFGVDVINPWTS